MNEDNGTEKYSDVPAIADDRIIEIAQQAERRIEAISKIKKMALRVTGYYDWTDQGGRPYMQVSGAEKVARLFGVSWRIDEPVLQWEEDGHFSYTYKGYFSMGTTEIEAIGTRASRDPFFSVKKETAIPPSEIDKGDVKKAAYTNCIGNGVSRILGIRNLTWEDLEGAGIDRTKISRIGYKQGSADPNAPATLPNYGDHAGKPVNDPSVPIGSLRYYLSGLEKSIADPTKEKYKVRNEVLRGALKAEIERRDAEAKQKEGVSPGSVTNGENMQRNFEEELKSASSIEEIESIWNAVETSNPKGPEKVKLRRIMDIQAVEIKKNMQASLV